MDFSAETAMSTALLNADQTRPTPRVNAQTPGQAGTSAREFEQFFVMHTLQSMYSGIEAEAPFGGGSGERAFRSFLLDEFAKQVVAAGGVGLADQVQAELVRMQAQAAQPAATAQTDVTAQTGGPLMTAHQPDPSQPNHEGDHHGA